MFNSKFSQQMLIGNWLIVLGNFAADLNLKDNLFSRDCFSQGRKERREKVLGGKMASIYGVP